MDIQDSARSPAELAGLGSCKSRQGAPSLGTSVTLSSSPLIFPSKITRRAAPASCNPYILSSSSGPEEPPG